MGGGGGQIFAKKFFPKCFSEIVGIVLMSPLYKWKTSHPLPKIGFPRSEMTWKHFVQKWKHLRIHGNFLETSEFCPKRSPMWFFDVLVGEGGRFQLIGAISKNSEAGNGPKKGLLG